MNTHQPCAQHESRAEHRVEGVPFCMECEIDALRDLLRQVANSDAVDAIQKVLGLSGGGFMTVFIKKDLWEQIVRLRNGNKKEG